MKKAEVAAAGNKGKGAVQGKKAEVNKGKDVVKFDKEMLLTEEDFKQREKAKYAFFPWPDEILTFEQLKKRSRYEIIRFRLQHTDFEAKKNYVIDCINGDMDGELLNWLLDCFIIDADACGPYGNEEDISKAELLKDLAPLFKSFPENFFETL
jgi:hypothetical protein